MRVTPAGSGGVDRVLLIPGCSRCEQLLAHLPGTAAAVAVVQWGHPRSAGECPQHGGVLAGNSGEDAVGVANLVSRVVSLLLAW